MAAEGEGWRDSSQTLRELSLLGVRGGSAFFQTRAREREGEREGGREKREISSWHLASFLIRILLAAILAA
jgi:hypothetical protein